MPDTVGPSATTIPVGRESWTTEHLYLHLTGKIEDLKSSLGDLRTADHLALQAALAAAKEAVAAALTAVKEANDKYEREVKEWRMNANEWRSAMDDREEKFVQKDHFHAAIRSLESQVHQMDGKLDDLTRSRDLAAGRQTAQTAIVGFIFAVITVALRFL